MQKRINVMKPKIITVTGGKGGTGKTLIAVNFAIMFKNLGKKVLLIDCDVDNPNTYLLLSGKLENQKEVSFFLPEFNNDICTKCGLCAENCMAHAILQVKDQYPIPILTLCSGCKLCYKLCPVKAIISSSKVIGWTYETKIRDIDLWVGELKVGEARSAAVIEKLIDNMEKEIETNPDKYDIVILDTAPGAHCDVEKGISTADYVISVTEPTPFGALDLRRIIKLIKLLGKSTKVILNRSSLLGNKEVFLRELSSDGINALGDIPLDKEIVNSYAIGVPIMDENTKFDTNGKGYIGFERVFNNLLEWTNIKVEV